MAKIPFYDDRMTPQGGLNTQARGVEFSGAEGAALQNLGNAGVSYAATELHFLRKKEDDDAIAGAGKAMSDATLKWDQYLKDASQNATDGANGFTGKTVAEFDAYAKETLAGINNPKAKQYAEQHFNSLRTSIGARAIKFEAEAGVADRDTKLEQAYQNYARVVANDGTQYESSRTALLGMIANLGYDPVTRADRAKRYAERLGESALQGQVTANPVVTKSTLSRTYGGDFGHALDFTLRAEGGLNPSDTNGTPSNFGINQAAHPEVDVKTITKDQAKAIYKKDYWDKIGGDQLAQKNPALATIAFDTAVIAGVGRAKQFLEQSGGDPSKFMDLREGYLAKLKADDPQKFAKYDRAWSTRNQGLRNEIGSAGAPSSPVVSTIARDMNIDRLPAFISAAGTEENRQQATYRSQVATTEGDHVTAYMNGQPVQKPLTQQEYTQAYGPVEGPQRFANYMSIAQLGTDINALKLQTPEQMAATVRAYEPDAAKPGYELATKRYDALIKAADAVNQARSSDPMAYAQQNKIGNAQPLNFNDQAAFGAELTRRTGVAATMQQTYGTPYTLLSKAESKTLNDGFQRMTTQQRLGYLDAIRASVTDPSAYRSIMGQIAPDSPVTAMAGMILQKQNPVIVKHTFSSDEVYRQQDVAGIMLEGEALLNPSKLDKSENGKGKTFPLPKEQDMRDQFTTVVGKAFAADPDGANFAYQAVKAYYVGKSAREGDISGTIDSGRMKEAITAVIGGVTDVNGKGEVVRPWGMTEERFKNGAKAAYDKQIEEAGYKGSPLDNWGAYGLQSAGDSKYLVRTGSGYLTTRTGTPIVLDLTEAPDMSRLIPGNNNSPALTPPATQAQSKTAKPNLQQPKTK